MSDRTRIARAYWAIMAASVLLVAAGPAVAQRPTVGAQAQRVARMQRAYREEERAYVAAERAKSASTPAETTFAGPLTVVSAAAVGDVARAGAVMAWRRMAPYFGADSTLLQESWYVVEVQGVSSIHLDEKRPREYGSVRALATGRDMADLIARMVSGRLLNDGSRDRFHEWVGNEVPMVYDSSTLRSVYIELVAAPSQIAHRCFAGELLSCRGALELDSLPDPVTAWYGPAERELMVSLIGPNYSSGRLARDVTRCTEGHDDASCTAFLRSLPPHVLRLPLSYTGRQSLVRTALSLGGRGAYGRLLASRGPARDRLALTAGVTTDSLVSAWRAQVLAARPKSQRVSAATQWSTAFWILVIASLALRSSRWPSA